MRGRKGHCNEAVACLSGRLGGDLKARGTMARACALNKNLVT
jgi:hypothetical protein